MGDLGRLMDLEEAVAGEYLRGLGADVPGVQGSQYGTSDEADWGRYGQQPSRPTVTWVPPPKKPLPSPPPSPLPQRPTLPTAPSRPLFRPTRPIPPQVLAIAQQATPPLLPTPKAEVVNLPPVIELPRADAVVVPEAAPLPYMPSSSELSAKAPVTSEAEWSQLHAEAAALGAKPAGPAPKSLEYKYSWDPAALARLQAAKEARQQRLRREAQVQGPSLSASVAEVVDNLTYGPQLPRAEVVEIPDLPPGAEVVSVPEPPPRAETVAVPQAPSPEGYRDIATLGKAVKAQLAGNEALRTALSDNRDLELTIREHIIGRLLANNVPLTVDDAMTILQSVKIGADKAEAMEKAAKIKKAAEEFSFLGRKPLTWVADAMPSEVGSVKNTEVIFHEVIQTTLDRLSKKFLDSGLTGAEKAAVTAQLRAMKAQNIPMESGLPLLAKVLSDKAITASGGNLTPIAPADQVGISYDWDPGEGRSGPAETRAMQAYSQVTKPFEMMFGRVTSIQDFVKKMKQILQVKGKGFKAPAQEYFERKYGKALFSLYSGANTPPSRDWSARERYEAGRQLRDLWNVAIKDTVEIAFDKSRLERELSALRIASAAAEGAARGQRRLEEGDVWQARREQQTKRLRGLGYFGQMRIPRPLG